jgi:hypothetical protein
VLRGSRCDQTGQYTQQGRVVSFWGWRNDLHTSYVDLQMRYGRPTKGGEVRSIISRISSPPDWLDRYCNMDYVFLSTMRSVHPASLYIRYDIACQWHKKFPARIKEFPPKMQLDIQNSELHYAVPKFHLNAHGTKCQTRFSLNFMTGAARTCGEGIETGWAHTNPVSTSIREMSPAGRRETLDDHWGGWNWRKIVGLGTICN